MAIGRRTFLLGATGALAISHGETAEPQQNRPPNIVWISAEDLSPDLGCYRGVFPGAEYAITPNLDKFAAEGARYDLAFSVTPVCAPSRSSIITAQYPTAIGTMHMRSRAIPPPETKCFPEYLRAAGYYCTNNSKTDYNFEPPLTAWDESSPKAHWRNRPDKNQPFFAVFNLTSTHESQIRLADDAFQNATRFLSPEERHDPAKAPIPPYYPDTPVVRRDWARYSDLITRMDKQVAALLQELADDGLADNTLVLFWGDHGRGLPRAKRWPYDSGLRVPLIARWPGKIAPGSVRQELVCLMDLGPTMLSAAGIPLPKQMHGVPFLDKDGKLPTKPREYVFGHRDRMDETYDRIRTVRDNRFRYIRNFEPQKPYAQFIGYAEEMPTLKEMRRVNKEESTAMGQGKVPNIRTPAQRLFFAPEKPVEELYDVNSDPHEIVNLAADPKYAAALKRLRDALSGWQKQYPDLGATPEPELIAKWRPNGKLPVTAAPEFRREKDTLVLTCATPGASLAWTTETGAEARWQLYSRPFVVPTAGTIRARACRIGYKDSPVTEISL
jgi:N-sulfoglucosamine sulfohydrolase